jgi:hypothetical protein
MINTYTLSDLEINFLLNQPEVIISKENIDKLSSGSIYFTINLNDELRQILINNFGLVLNDNTKIPMRWIKGDTQPHIDRGSKIFDRTYLAYLTDSPGELIIDSESYPINKGNAYVFNEGLSHETIGTGFEPRLLLGPMSEKATAVGAATEILADGETEIIYLKYIVNELVNGVFYKINNGDYNDISLPLTIANTNPEPSFKLQVLFENTLVLQSNIWYINCGSDNIQFGSSTPSVITIDNINSYLGFIKNGGYGDSTPPVLHDGYNNITIQNIGIKSISGSTLADQGGWVCQTHFGRGASNNNIINCYSTGDIIPGSGGIVGTKAASNGGSLTINKCFSTGFIDNEAGGIVGNNAAYGDGGPDGTITITNCYSTGVIGGVTGGGGGIVGSFATNIIISNCYSLGEITGYSAAGIIGVNFSNNNTNTTINNCYSIGNMSGAESYGIAPVMAVGGSYLISNCYTSGTLIGLNSGGLVPYPPVSTINNSYSEGDNGGSGWNDINANNSLTGVNLGIWTPIFQNSYYFLSLFNETLYNQSPYTSTTPGIFQTTPGLIQMSEPGFKYIIYGETNPNITINQSNGVITFDRNLPRGSYTVNVFSCIDPPQIYYNYNINTFVFEKVKDIEDIIPNIPICFLAGTPVLTDQGEIAIEKIDIKKHTIRGQKIVAITESIPDDSYLICIEKNSLTYNVPNRRTIISKDHKVMCDKKLVRAEYLIQYIPTIYKIPYNKQKLYNVLLNDHSTMLVNNLVVETMNPNNALAKVYSRNYTVKEKNEIIKFLNKVTTQERKKSVLTRNMFIA